MKNSRVLKRALEWKSAMESGHTRKGNFQLTPSEVRKLRKYVLHRGKATDIIVMYMVILGGVKLFLRVEEALSLTVEQFVHKLFQVDPMAMCTLVVCAIQGKGDKHPFLFNIFEDKEEAKFDLVLHLLDVVLFINYWNSDWSDVSRVRILIMQ
jgi:hypothetical protein